MIGSHFIRCQLSRDVEFIATLGTDINRNQLVEEALIVQVKTVDSYVKIANFSDISSVYTERSLGGNLDTSQFWVNHMEEGNLKAQKELKKLIQKGGHDDVRRNHLKEYYEWVQKRKLVNFHAITNGGLTEVRLTTSSGLLINITLTVGTQSNTVNAIVTLPQYNITETFTDVQHGIVNYALSKHMD